MRYGIPLIGDRVAPRSTIADEILVVTVDDGALTRRKRVSLEHDTWFDVTRVLRETRADTLVCGGIDRETKGRLNAQGFRVIDNVASTAAEVCRALARGTLRSGFGFFEGPASPAAPTVPVAESGDAAAGVAPPDCLSCVERVCLRGDPCALTRHAGPIFTSEEDRRVLEAALDISSERERTLCRLAEIIYFGLEMRYRRIGLAFCHDVRESAEVLTRILRRFFEVVPVSCRVGGRVAPEAFAGPGGAKTSPETAGAVCHPLGQADVLNRENTELNVVAGLCMGTDCLFSRASRAPVTTFLVKDRSLAHNPIGALYSDHYLREIARTDVARTS